MNEEVAKYYKALSNPVRLAVFLHVAEESEGAVPSSPKEESCVSAISRHLNIPQPTVSNHLRVLKQAGLIKCIKKDTHSYQYVTKSAAKALLSQSTYLFEQAKKNPY